MTFSFRIERSSVGEYVCQSLPCWVLKQAVKRTCKCDDQRRQLNKQVIKYLSKEKTEQKRLHLDYTTRGRTFWMNEVKSTKTFCVSQLYFHSCTPHSADKTTYHFLCSCVYSLCAKARLTCFVSFSCVQTHVPMSPSLAIKHNLICHRQGLECVREGGSAAKGCML